MAHFGKAWCGGVTGFAALGLAAAGMTGSTAVALAAPAVGVPPTWHIMQDRVLPGAAPDNGLFGVSCPSPGSCVAVGDEGYSTAQRTLVESLRAGYLEGYSEPGHPWRLPRGLPELCFLHFHVLLRGRRLGNRRYAGH